YAVAFSPDSQTLATASGDDSTILWDVSDPSSPAIPSTASERTGQRWLGLLSGHIDAVRSVAFSPDGRMLVTGSDDNTALLWDIVGRVNPDLLATLNRQGGPVLAVAYNPNKIQLLATANADGTATLWDLTDRIHPVVLARLMEHTDSVNALAF